MLKLQVFLISELLQDVVNPNLQEGVKLVVHPTGTLPNVGSEGVQVATGTDASVAINVNKVSTN